MTLARNLPIDNGQSRRPASAFGDDLTGLIELEIGNTADFLLVAWIDVVNLMLTSSALKRTVSRIRRKRTLLMNPRS